MHVTLELLAVTAPIVPLSDVVAPTVVVERLLEASDRQDWSTALAMLTADAQLGMGDVGGPLNKETVPILGLLAKHGCRITSTRETTERYAVDWQIRFVEVKRMCPYGARSGRSGEHEIVVTYFVKGAKIAGFYLQ